MSIVTFPEYPTKASAPDYVLKQRGFTTQRQWRMSKRRELNALMKAFGAYRFGCVFTPARDGEVGRIQEALLSLRKALSVKNWDNRK